MSNGIGFMIESLVAALLMLTIGFCILLNRRLKVLKADEQALKATISELITATEIAERAIAGLKVTARECDQTLGERLRAAKRLSSDIAEQIETGDEIVERLAQIALAARPERAPAAMAIAPDAKGVAAAAQAFALRARQRSAAA